MKTRMLLCAIGFSLGLIGISSAPAGEKLQGVKAEAEGILKRLGWQRYDKGNIALLNGDWPGQNRTVIDTLAAALRQAGYQPTLLDTPAFMNPFVVSSELFDLLVITGGRELPIETAPTLACFLKNQGNLAWEPFIGRQSERTRWDKRWSQWIQRRYLTIKAAEKAWGFPVPRNNEGQVTNPLDTHCGSEGAWGKMVADYRRFIDEIVDEHYTRARHMVRSIDPHHLVSFRMTVAGDPTFNQAHNMPYDFRGLARGVDLFEPEGYGRIGDWKQVCPGMFTEAFPGPMYGLSSTRTTPRVSRESTRRCHRNSGSRWNLARSPVCAPLASNSLCLNRSHGLIQT
jgi:hypothetical protein